MISSQINLRVGITSLFLYALLVPFGTALAQAAPRIKVLKISVTNPTETARPDENIVIAVADLRRVAPDFSPAAFMVTTSDAATVKQDARVLRNTELPSQADDIDGDGKSDEIAFQIELKPKQTRVVTIAFGDAASLQSSRGEYPKRTHAAFNLKYEGMGWESEVTAWRLYFDQRNAIDLFGKRRPGLYLEMFGARDYDYHEESPYGRDIYKIGDALGIGAVGALVDGKAVRVSDVKERSWRVVASGPVRSVVLLNYKGWKVGGREVNLTSRITQWAGQRAFQHRIAAEGAEGVPLVTALVRKPGLEVQTFTPTAQSPILWRASWGHQVLKTGATATESLPDQNLGLAIIAPGAESKTLPDDSLNWLVQPEIKGGIATWYILAAWDQENLEISQVSSAIAAEKHKNNSLFRPHNGITTSSRFIDLVKDAAQRISRPALVSILSKAAVSN